MTISDILRHKATDAARPAVVTIDSDTPVSVVLSTLAEHDVGALVVTADGTVRGIVSERDIARRLAAAGAATLDEPVRALMTTDVVTCGPNDKVDAIAETMTARRIRHMPVLDGDQLIGIVSIGDVVLSRIRQLEQDRGQLEQYIAG